jgi:hypothetical protein
MRTTLIGRLWASVVWEIAAVNLKITIPDKTLNFMMQALGWTTWTFMAIFWRWG